MATADRDAPGAGRPTILVIDDDARVLASFKGLFEMLLPIEVATAESGAAGLDLLQRRSVRLVIVDFRMPGMNGLEFIQRARELAPELPYYLFTAYASEELKRLSAGGRPQRYVSKNEMPEHIAAFIAEDLGLDGSGRS